MKHKITLTFEYTAEDKTNLDAIRRFIDRSNNYDTEKTGTEELLVTENDKCRYVLHDGRYGSEFECNTLADFITKYGPINPRVISYTMAGFAKLTEVAATRIDEEG